MEVTLLLDTTLLNFLSDNFAVVKAENLSHSAQSSPQALPIFQSSTCPSASEAAVKPLPMIDSTTTGSTGFSNVRPPSFPLNAPYASCYCEENVYLLVEALNQSSPLSDDTQRQTSSTLTPTKSHHGTVT